MIAATKSPTVSFSHLHNDWSFLPTASSVLAGVGIGIALGYCLGWL
jgi:hypothetical protein